MPELRGYPKREKRQRAKKRKLVGYDRVAPQMCMNCIHFKPEYVARNTDLGRERFPPLCKKHEFEVDKYATCNTWEDNEFA